MNEKQLEIILWIQSWYFQFCDGDWEHNETINIHTIDNPGWRVTIDLEGTDRENKKFENVKNEISDTDWYHCFLREGRFEGAGGPHNLIDILCIFKNWAEAKLE